MRQRWSVPELLKIINSRSSVAVRVSLASDQVCQVVLSKFLLSAFEGPRL